MLNKVINIDLCSRLSHGVRCIGGCTFCSISICSINFCSHWQPLCGFVKPKQSHVVPPPTTCQTLQSDARPEHETCCQARTCLSTLALPCWARLSKAFSTIRVISIFCGFLLFTQLWSPLLLLLGWDKGRTGSC